MAPIIISPCTASDGPAIAENNIPAFWTDSTWVLIWPGKTCDYVTEQAARRTPHTLLMDPAHRRHQMAVDEGTGAVVGYCRWILPCSAERAPEAASAEALDHSIPCQCMELWPEARAPKVEDEEVRLEFERQFKAADWEYDHSLDVLDESMMEMKARLMAKKNYILLDYMAVRPEYRGQGIATNLVESGLRAVEGIGLDVCVLAMKAALGVYQRAGFTLLEYTIQDDSKFGGTGEYGAYFLEKEFKARD